MFLEEKKDKWYYSKKNHNKREFFIYDLCIENDIALNSIFNFIKKYLPKDKIIIELSTVYHDELATVDDYLSIEKKYIQKKDRFEYIYNNNYKMQLALLLTDNAEFDLESFKNLTIYGGMNFLIGLRCDEFDNLLYTLKKSRHGIREYDNILLSITEDYISIKVNDISQYPNLEGDICTIFTLK